jgi:thiamine biosynthesis protein ThiS
VIEQRINLTLNGKRREFAVDTTLVELLTELGIDRRMIAVALNGDVLPRAQYEGVVLKDGDQVEVVRMVGGG